MGRKRGRERKFFYLYFAGLVFLVFPGCASLENFKVKMEKQVEARQSLYSGKELLAQRDYEGAFRENLKVLSLGLHKPPEDEALFNIGLIYVHPGNPKKDYKKSVLYFKRLTEDFPKSPWTERVRIWEGILQENEKLNLKIGTLNQRIETLNQISEKSKQENMKIEESEGGREFLLRSQKLVAQGNYEAALKENQRGFSLSGKNPPGDEALFNIGLIYAHSGNPKKDYGKAILFFNKLTKDCPQSPWVEQARIWTAVLQENEKLKQSIENLNQVMEKSKQVDIEIEEKKREKAK